MARFHAGSLVIEQICLDSSPKPDDRQRNISLQLTGWMSQPDIKTSENSPFLRITSITHDTRHKRSTFHIEAVKDAQGVGYVFDKASNDDTVLRVTVGKVTNHDGFQHDLLAELLGRSEDPVKLLVYQRILSRDNNIVGNWEDWDRILKDQPIKQITDPEHPANWNCGAAASNFGNTYFGSTHFTAERTRYYKPFRPRGGVNKKDDIQFDADKLAKGIAGIRRLLEQKAAVRVFAVHDDGFTVENGIIKQTGATHYLTIIGCDAAGEKFLVTDPWPGGSRLIYKSGIFGNVDSAFMGLLQNFGGSAGIRVSEEAQRGAHTGPHEYLVLSGP